MATQSLPGGGGMNLSRYAHLAINFSQAVWYGRACPSSGEL